MQTNPKYSDGKAGIANPIVENLCVSGQFYNYLSDSIDRESIEKDHTDADGGPLGSDTREGFEKGAINLQLSAVTDTIARPGHIIKLDIGDGFEYFVAGKFGRARTRNDVTKGSLQVKKAINPVITTLLSAAYGQGFKHTQAAGALAGAVLTSVAVNTRDGSTLVWSIAASPGFTVPGWLSINASTGVISGTAVAGTFEVQIVLTDTLAGSLTRVGYGILNMVITA